MSATNATYSDAKDGPLAVTETKSDGPDLGSKNPTERDTENSVSLEDIKGLLDVENENSFVSMNSDKTESFPLKPVFTWASEVELADARGKKALNSEVATSPKEDRDAEKREAYEEFVASMNVMSNFRVQARKKLEKYRLTREEKRELMAQLLLEEGDRGLSEGPVVKFDESFVLNEAETGDTDETVKRSKTTSEDRSSAEPMSVSFEEKIDKMTSKVSEKAKEPEKGKVTTRTSERVDGNTFLGHVFGRMGRGGGSDPEDSSSDEDSNGGGAGRRLPEQRPHRRTDQSGDESEHDELPKKRRGRYSAIKPTPPEKYNGEPDVQRYFKFVAQSVAYCDKGQIPTEDQVQEVSYFLTGEAYKFYLNEVSMEEHRWNLTKFVKRLFDYCFPPNYRLKEQQKLETFKQGTMRVRPYAAKLKNKYQIIGYAHKREKVRKLWWGLQPRLQQKLFENGYDPERSKWGEVVDAAELYEIAREMGLGTEGGSRREQGGQRDRNKPQKNGGRGHGTFEKQKRDNGDSGTSPAAKPAGTDAYSNKTPYNRRRQTDSVRKGPDNRKSRLTEEERTRHQNEGRCFNCGEMGHVSNKCPDNDKVRSSGSGPPGVRSNKISFDLAETEELRESGEPEELTSGVHIQVAAMRFTNVRITKRPRGRPRWQRNFEGNLRDYELTEGRDGRELLWGLASKREVGCWDLKLDNPRSSEGMADPYALQAEYLLESQQPYPGDHLRKGIDGRRFLVYRTSDTQYVIYDLLNRDDGNIVEDSLITDEHCSITRYYAKLMGDRMGVDISGSRRWFEGAPTGDAKADQMACVLEKGYSRYTGKCRTIHLDRFGVKGVWNGVNRSYVVEDRLLCFREIIDSRLVERNGFDLRGWYCKRVGRYARSVDLAARWIWNTREGLNYDKGLRSGLQPTAYWKGY
ncbi:hypothetical protein H0H92_011575 [Tricholoma furcatifolium]|nr:hypothetical protein H0H92_011575 [Tricholoma furcatifolium]